MLTLLQKLFIKDNGDANVKRRKIGMLCSGYGIFLNILLFIGKYFAGVISSSIAITADAFNNLSDAGSSLISLIGFKFAGMKPDPKHPFGHGRIEYLSGLGISVAILVVAFELFRSSLDKILHPESVDTSYLAMGILVVSIIVKFYMFFYNRRIGTKIDSAGMKATAMDSISDTIATFVVLISMIITKFTGVNIDGYTGILVALFIFYAGFTSAKDTLAPLLGTTPDKEFVDQINDIVMGYDKVHGIHDLVVHDYGPGRQFISLHAEVDGRDDIYEIHDEIDRIERDLYEKLGCEATIHMDPIQLGDERVTQLRSETAILMKNIHIDVTIHDFRVVPGTTHTNLIFDIVIPFEVKMTDDEIREKVQKLVSEKRDNYFTVIQIDRNYI
ncbi:MAG: cation transporter [Oscillospiraceae bacterium]|nr:cation transporter [Candidatus Ruminococcus equi]